MNIKQMSKGRFLPKVGRQVEPYLVLLNKKQTMLFKALDSIPSFTAGDDTWLKEVLHPDNDKLDLAYSVAYAIIEPESQSKAHHLKNSEVYLFLSGKGEIFIDGKSQFVTKGSIVYVPPMSNQYVVNKGREELTFYCIVSPAWRKEDEFV